MTSMDYSNIFAGVALGVVVVALLIVLVFYIFYVIGLAKLFKKAGIEGWKAIIPFYSDYLFTCKVCGLHWAWYVGLLVGSFAVASDATVLVILRLFVKCMSFYNLAIRCNKEIPPTLIFGTLFPEITTMVYGYGKAELDPYKEVKSSGLF